MKKLIVLIAILALTGCAQPVQVQVISPITTYITSEDIGQIAVQIEFPSSPRYEEGAPIIIYTPTFFTQDTQQFKSLEGITDQGFIEISMILPGREGPNGIRSDGTNDYGGEDSMKAFRDVIKFASGDLKNTDGKTLCELIPIIPVYSDVGIYAFSHPGILATNTLAIYGSELRAVDYFVGRENPTNDQLSALEVGQYVQLYEDGGESGMKNILYDYTEDYSPKELTIDYSSIMYDQENKNPYFDEKFEDYVFGEKVPEMFGKRCYSVALLSALLENGSLTRETWPQDLATPEEASEWWSIRETNDYYSLLTDSLPTLKVMLVFADLDHVQTVEDKPHIHQAYDGFHEIAGLWTRLNPDSSYLKSLDVDTSVLVEFTEHDANTEPEDWGDIGEWSYRKSQSSNILVPLAGVLEMADRTYYGEWGEDLEEVLQK